VLPCRNEAPALPALLARMPSGYRPIVVDNGSSDGTAEVARAYGVEVVVVAGLGRSGKSGLGTAYRAGFAAALADHPARHWERHAPPTAGKAVAPRRWP